MLVSAKAELDFSMEAGERIPQLLFATNPGSQFSELTPRGRQSQLARSHPYNGKFSIFVLGFVSSASTVDYPHSSSLALACYKRMQVTLSVSLEWGHIRRENGHKCPQTGNY